MSMTDLIEEPTETSVPSGATEEGLEKAKAEGSELLTMEPSPLGKYVRKRLERFEKAARVRAAELKVAHLKYRGYPFVEIHPKYRDQIYLPPDVVEYRPKTENRIPRALDRYVAQVTADEPVLQAIPATGEDDDRDKAEAATHGLRGETHRLRSNRKLKRIMTLAGIYRSAFKLFYWDSQKGEAIPAVLKEVGEDGEIVEVPVDAKGEPTEESGRPQAEIPQGELCDRILTPFQVHFSEDADFAHDADEVIVGVLLTLRKLFDHYPAAKKLKLEELFHGVPRSAAEFLDDLSGTGGKTVGYAEDRGDVQEGLTGESVPEDGAILDRKVYFVTYYRSKCRAYPNGFYCYVVGRTALEGKTVRGDLKAWGGRPPIVHYKFLEDAIDRYGRGFVDVARGAQDLLDFVNGHIYRYLQSLNMRYLLHTNTRVQGGVRSLRAPHETAIYWSGQTAPSRLEPPAFPEALLQAKDRVGRFYDDEQGIHESSRGLHVPGVQSGEHVRQLALGDETLLGLTREMMIEALQAEGRLILGAIKHYWKDDRLARYIGRDKEWVTKQLKATDLGSTEDVLLVKGSLLMMTPAQRAQSLASYAQLGILDEQEVRLYMPFADTTGVSLHDDPHYLRARRQNELFLDGPPPELVEARAFFQQQAQDLEAATAAAAAAGFANAFQAELEEIEAAWQEALAPLMPTHLPFEDDAEIAGIHFREHARGTARQKVDEFLRRGLDWWVEPWLRHVVDEGTRAGRIQPPAAPQAPDQAAAPAGSAPSAPAAAPPAGPQPVAA